MLEDGLPARSGDGVLFWEEPVRMKIRISARPV